MKKSLWLGSLVMLCLWGAPLLAQPVETCNGTDLELPDFTTETSTIEVVDTDTIAELNVSVSLSHTWVGNISNMSVVSPSGTSVLLHAGLGSFTSDFNCVYSDVGKVDTGSVPLTGLGVPSPYNCSGCLMRPYNFDATTLNDFEGQALDGEWDLNVTNSSGFGPGELNSWCVRSYAVDIVGDLTCTADEDTDGIANFTFTPGSDYDDILVYTLGELLTTLEGPFTAGVGASASLDTPLPVPQFATFTFVGVVAGVEGAPNSCDVGLLLDPLACAGDFTGDTITSGVPFISITEFATDVTIANLTVQVDLTTMWLPYFDLSITSYTGTNVQLHNSFAGTTGDNFDVTYSDFGVPNGSVPYGSGATMKPSGPGTLSNFSGEDTVDDDGNNAFAFFAMDTFGSGTSTLNSYDICIFDSSAAQALTGVTCADGGGLGTVTISWTNPQDYDGGFRIIVNGVAVIDDPTALSSGDTGSFTTDEQTIPSFVEVCVVGFNNGAPSAPACCRFEAILPPVADLACSPDGATGEVTVSWTIPEALGSYDFYNVFVDGVLDISIDDGTATSYLAGPFDVPGVVQIGIQGGTDVPEAVAEVMECTNVLLPPTEVEECAIESDGFVSSTVSSIEVDAVYTIEEVTVITELTANWFYYANMKVESPSGIEVTIHSSGGFTDSVQRETLIVWDDDGEDIFSFPTFPLPGDWDDAELIRPTGPGAFSDFDGSPTAGTWDLTVTDTFGGGTFDLQSWCLRVDGCPAESPSEVVCEVVADDAVDISWSNNGPGAGSSYSEIYILIDDELFETIGGGDTSYTAEGLTSAIHKFEVQGFVASEDCVAGGARCNAAPGFLCVDDPGGPEFAVNTSEIETIDFLTINHVTVITDLNSGFFGTTLVDVESPDGTDVRLHGASGYGPPGYALTDFAILVTWDDEGVAVSSLFSGSAPGDSGEWDDGLLVAPEGPGKLSDFINEGSLGTWQLTVDSSAHSPATFSGTDLNSWCLHIDGCPILPPSELTCDVTSDDTVTLMWGNGDAYSEHRVYANDALLATLPGGTDTSYIASGLEVGRYTFQVEGYSASDDCGASTDECRTSIGFISSCAGPEAVVASGPTVPAFMEVDVFDSVDIGDVEVLLQTTATFQGDLDFFLTSPFGTEVWVADPLSTETLPFDVVWSSRDGAISFGSPFDCGGCVMMSSPGELADFRGELSDGEWELRLAGFTTMTVNLFCVDIYPGCGVTPPSVLTCEDSGQDVILNWENNGLGSGGAYNSIRIEANGQIVADDLAGSTESYTHENVLSGFYDYRVFGGSDLLACESGSQFCHIAKGIVEVCDGADVFIGYASSATATLAVEDDIVIDNTNVLVEMTTSWVDEFDIFVRNPDGDEVQVANNPAPPTSHVNFNCLFSDKGDAQPVPTYDCDGCLVAPSGPGALSDLSSGSPIGDWELEITNTATFGGSGTLTNWCLQLYQGCDIPRPTILSCDTVNSDGLPPVTITWEGTTGADFVTIIRNGITIVDNLPDTQTSYTDNGITESGRNTYQVGYGSTELDCVRASTTCETEALGRFEACNEESFTLGLGALELVVLDWSNAALEEASQDPGFDSTITDVEVDIDLTTTWLNYIDATLFSPGFTSVQLLNNNYIYTGSVQTVIVTFSDAGSSTVNLTNFDCDCLVRPTGPGSMSDFVSEEPVGEWLFALVESSNSFEHTFNRWCIGVFTVDLPDTTIETPEILYKRGDVNNNGVTDPLSDALRLLQWGFAGGLAPPCMCAADADGNHAVSALNDAIRLLSWGFSGGAAPPAPGPTTCGSDPQDPEGCDLTGLDGPGEACGTTTGHGRFCEP